MIEVKEIQLDITLPDDGVGMVTMQPFVELCDHEPYCWQDNKKHKQIERIIRTLKIAKQADHGRKKTHFTVFPEYSIPGVEGVQKIQEILENSSWKDGTIVIGGVDSLTKDEYSTLCNEDMTQVYEKNKAEEIRDGKWVNCCIVWARKQDGTLSKWIQPKIVPSWSEKNITCNNMFCGKSVYIFKCRFENGIDCHFLSLICFDWIGRIDSNEGIWAALSKINDYWKDSGKKDIHFIFVIQNNDVPNHRDFLGNARNYFEKRSLYPFALRDNCAIIFVNSAGGSAPGKYFKYGYSSLICQPNAPYDVNGCPPTFATITDKLRGTDNLGRCKEALFREMGACIHSFNFRHPSFINLDPADRCLPIHEAIVHAIDDGIDDPRTPGRPVPASVKWVNDQLDKIASLLENEHDHPLKDNIERAYGDISEEIRKQSGDFLRRYIVRSLREIEEEGDKYIKIGERKIHNVDNWDENEEKSLETVVHSLSIMKVCKPLEVNGSPTHATIKVQDKVIDVIVVSGGTHEECFKYAKNQYPGSEQRFVVVVTHDGRSSLPEGRRRNSILDVEYNSSRGPYIADPASRFDHCGYQNLIDNCFHSQSLEELNDKISEIMGV